MNKDQTFNYKLKGKAKLASKLSVGIRADKLPSFHITLAISATMNHAMMHEVLQAMGLSNTTFVDDLPEEINSVPIPAAVYRDHSMLITSTGKVVARLDHVELSNFVVTVDSDTAQTISCAAKFLPPMDELVNVLSVLLDCHKDMKFMFEIGEPPQLEIDTGDAAEETGSEEATA